MLLVEVVIVDPVGCQEGDAERLEQLRHFLADVAAAMDADGAALEMEAVADRRPMAFLEVAVVAINPAQQPDHHANGQLGDRDAVGAGNPPKPHAAVLEGLRIDMVGTDRTA